MQKYNLCEMVYTEVKNQKQWLRAKQVNGKETY